jgi:hypothetical protein
MANDDERDEHNDFGRDGSAMAFVLVGVRISAGGLQSPPAGGPGGDDKVVRTGGNGVRRYRATDAQYKYVEVQAREMLATSSKSGRVRLEIASPGNSSPYMAGRLFAKASDADDWLKTPEGKKWAEHLDAHALLPLKLSAQD